MARQALKQKQARLEAARVQSTQGKAAGFSIVKHYNRCKLCGRTHGYMREFGICRVCFRKYAREGMIVGMRKAAW